MAHWHRGERWRSDRYRIHTDGVTIIYRDHIIANTPLTGKIIYGWTAENNAFVSLSISRLVCAMVREALRRYPDVQVHVPVGPVRFGWPHTSYPLVRFVESRDELGRPQSVSNIEDKLEW